MLARLRFCSLTCIACCALGTLCPLLWISQHRQLLSQDPAIKNDVDVTDGGEKRRQEIESSGGFETSTSFMGFAWFPSPKLMPPPVLPPNPPVDPKEEVWPNIVTDIGSFLCEKLLWTISTLISVWNLWLFCKHCSYMTDRTVSQVYRLFAWILIKFVGALV